MEIITWACFFVFVALLSFLIYNTLSKSAEDDMFEEERAYRRKNYNNNKQNQEQIRLAAEKAKEKKLKKQTKKQNQKKLAELEAAENEEPADTENDSPAEEIEKVVPQVTVQPVAQVQAQAPTKKNKSGKQQQAESDKSEKKNLKAEVKMKKEVAVEVAVEVDAPGKDDKTKKVKQAVDKAPLPPKKQKAPEKPAEIKKPVEVVEEKPVEVVEAPVQQLPIKKEVAKPIQAPPNQNTVKHIPPKQNKKKKNEITNLQQLKNDTEAVNINFFIELVQKAELSRSENQLLIDALLNKQQDDISEWLQGRQDPLVKLKKQLMEAEQALKDEKEAGAGLQAKLKELRVEINNEKSTHRQLEERLAASQNESQAYSFKFQQALEEQQAIAVQHSNCLQQIKQCQKQLNDEKIALLKLKEEQSDAEEQYHEAIRAVQNECTEYAVTSQQFQAEAANLRTQLAMLQEQSLIVNEDYLKSKNELERVLNETQFQASKLQTELNTASREISEVREELNHVTALFNNSELEKQNLIEQAERLSAQLSTLHSELITLRDQNETLSKNCSENWENGFSYNNKQGLAEYDAKLEETENSIKSLKNELDLKVTKIEELNTVILTCKNENTKKDALLQKAQAEIDSLKAAPSPVKIIEDNNLSQLKNVVAEKNKEISNLKNEIETHKQRNNELRNKNWKVIEALKQAEERSQHNKKNSEISAAAVDNNLEAKIENWVKGVVLKVNPNIVLEDKGNDDITAWLKKVEMAFNVPSSSKPDGCSECQQTLQYLNQINQLQTLVEHYKKVIVDTEGMLNELQNNVESKEAEWKEKISNLEGLVEHLHEQYD